MLRTKFIMIAVFAAFFVTPVAAFADAPKVSYSDKKQGRVAFKDKAKSEKIVAKDVSGDVNPADIEPAVGDYEPENNQKSDVAKSIKLPRKN